jgi:hypothetical protein
MTEILPMVEPDEPQPSRWWWQPLWRQHPIRFALVVLLVIAGGIAWGIPAGLALRGAVFPPKPVPTIAPVTPTPTPTPTHTHRRRTQAPQPVYTPPPTHRATPTPTRPHSPSPRPTHHTPKPTPTPEPTCSALLCDSPPEKQQPKTPNSQANTSSGTTKDFWRMLTWW